MSKLETPLTKRLWQEVGGTLVLEFLAVRPSASRGKRLIDGVIVLGGEKRLAKTNEVTIAGKDIIVVQTKANRLGMYLLGQAVFSRHLMERFNPRSIRSIAVCTMGDDLLEPLASEYDVEVAVYEPD